MKKVISILLASLMLVMCFAVAETAETAPVETRECAIVIEGVEETITETLHADEAGYSIWYQADLLKLELVDGNAYFFAIDSTVEGEEPGFETSSSYVTVVPTELTAEESVGYLAEAVGGYDPAVAVIGEETSETLENGVRIDTVSVEEEGVNYTFYVITNGELVLCVNSVCPVDALCGWCVRFDHMIKSIEF